MTRSARRPALSFVLFFAACDPGGSEPPQPAAGAETPAPLNVGREIRLASPEDVARFGFRSDGAGFAAEADTHEVEIAAGVLRVTPRHLGRAGAPIELETARVARGGQPVELAVSGAAIDGETGGVDVRRAGLTETIESFAGGVEQSWRFERAPAGSGELLVEVAVLGHDYVSTTERGLHFAAAGGLGFRYSHAVWVTADGHEVAIAAEHVAGAIRMTVPGEVVAASAFPAVLDPVVEAEVRVDRPVIGGTGDPSDQVDVASSGSQYLAVWRHNIPEDPSGYEVRAVRIAADGTVIDDTPVLQWGDFSEEPSVAFLDGSYLVAFGDWADARLVEVGTDGTVQSIGLIGTDHPNGANQTPDIAAGTGDAMIVYYESSFFRRIWAVPYSGGALQPEVELGGFATSRPRIAAQPGGDYFAVWADDSENIRGRFISPAGVPGAEVPITSGSPIDDTPAVAWTGTGFAVVWQRATPDTQQIRAVHVSPGGVIGSPVAVSSLAFAASEPDVTCDGTCQVVWSGGPDDVTIDLRGRRLNADATPAGSEVVVASGVGDQGPAALAGTGGSYYLTWVNAQSGVDEAYGATATPSGDGLALGTSTLLATERNYQTVSAVVTSTSSWLVAWSDTRNGGFDIFGKRFDLAGVERTRNAKAIHEAPERQIEVKLGWNGSRYLAAWRRLENPGLLQVTRIEPNGTVLDPAGIQLGTGNGVSSVEVAGGAGDWLAIWTRSGLNGRRLLARVVHGDGTSSALATVSDNAGSPSVARDPATGVYVVAWFTVTPAELRAVRIDSSGAILDSTPITLATGVSGGPLELAAGGGVFLLAWPSSASTIHGLRFEVGAGGIQALSPGVFPLVADGANRNDEPTLTFTAKGFLMAYERRATLTGEFDIYGLQVGVNGQVQGPPFVIADDPASEINPALAGASQGRALVSYEYRTSAASPTRIYVRRIVAAYPDGATCTSGAQCESGFCADGRCCDSACGGGAIDCQACSVSAGAAEDGVCGVVAADEVCRTSEGFCDLAERCDGVALDCPDDRGRREGQVCDADCGAVCPLNDESGSPHVCPVCP